jgi:hypothetical protein
MMYCCIMSFCCLHSLKNVLHDSGIKFNLIGAWTSVQLISDCIVSVLLWFLIEPSSHSLGEISWFYLIGVLTFLKFLIDCRVDREPERFSHFCHEPLHFIEHFKVKVVQNS